MNLSAAALNKMDWDWGEDDFEDYEGRAGSPSSAMDDDDDWEDVEIKDEPDLETEDNPNELDVGAILDELENREIERTLRVDRTGWVAGEMREKYDVEIRQILDSLGPSWSVLTDVPEFDDMYERAGNSLEKMFEQFGTPLADVDENPKIYLCRYEFVKTPGNFNNPDGIMEVFPGNKLLYFHFLTSFPIDCAEMTFLFGQYSSIYSKEQITRMKAEGVSPPVPTSFFEGHEPDRVLHNITALDRILDKNYYGVVLEFEGLQGESEPDGVKWWAKTNIQDTDTLPIPGEFCGLGVRMMPGEYSGPQESSPFVYAGNWIDYIWYSSAEVVELEVIDDVPYMTVQWRKEQIRLATSDYAQYQVGDRVTVLKRIDVNKVTQAWSDADTMEADVDEWVILPVMFYGIEYGSMS